MAELKIKIELPPSRCEVCHQNDYFDPELNQNHCSRCIELVKQKILLNNGDEVLSNNKLLYKSIMVTLLVSSYFIVALPGSHSSDVKIPFYRDIRVLIISRFFNTSILSSCIILISVSLILGILALLGIKKILYSYNENKKSRLDFIVNILWFTRFIIWSSIFMESLYFIMLIRMYNK